MKFTSELKKFVKMAEGCRHTKVIKNAYGDDVTVPCGHCKYCLLKKASILELYCKMEESTSKYCYMCSLDYDNNFVPALIFERFDDIVEPHVAFEREIYDVKGRKVRDYYNEDYLQEFLYKKGTSVYPLTKNDENELLHKINSYSIKKGRKTIDFFPVLLKKDLQNFLKRLRKTIKKNHPNAELRYFATGEYGPKTYRPHFHVLLYFDDFELSKNIISYCSESWQFGNANTSSSRRKVSSYVSSYVNSFSDFPDIYKTFGFSTFNSHSVYFGVNFYKNYTKDIYQNGFQFFAQSVVKVFEKELQIIPPSSVLDYFYPRCKGFNYIPFNEKVSLYTFKNNIRNILPSSQFNNSEISLFIVYQYILEHSPFHSQISSLIDDICDFLPIDSFQITKDITSFYNIANDNILAPDLDKRIKASYLYNVLYDILSTSDKFEEFIYHFNKSNHIDKSYTYPYYVRIINKFYSDRCLNSLMTQYTNMEAYSNLCQSEDEFDSLYTFYDFPFDTELHNYFEDYAEFSINVKYNNSIKHKVLNDLNGLLSGLYNKNEK
nr:MAG TPA: Replication associated protein [Microviridae sp.]